VAYLNTSKTYEVWVRDAYAKAFTGEISEAWNPYVINGNFEEGGYPIPGWIAGGSIGHGSGSTTLNQTRVVGLQQFSHGSDIYQDVELTQTDLVYSFWYKGYPEGTSIEFVAKIDDITIFSDSFTGLSSSQEWHYAQLYLKPFLSENNFSIGTHRIYFQVPASTLPHAWVEIDEVKIVKMSEIKKSVTALSLESIPPKGNIGEKLSLNGVLSIPSNLLDHPPSSLQFRYSSDGGLSWWDLPDLKTDSEGRFVAEWIPSRAGIYIIEVAFQGDDWFLPSSLRSPPISVGTVVEVDKSAVSSRYCGVNTTQESWIPRKVRQFTDKCGWNCTHNQWKRSNYWG